MTREAEIQARVEKATPAPWVLVPTDNAPPPGFVVIVDGTDLADNELSVCADPPRSVEWAHDAAFIAAAREDVPWLLSEVSRLRTLVRDVAQSGVVCAGPGYLEVQIECATWDDLQAVRKELEADRGTQP